jgi:hypothetical protein
MGPRAENGTNAKARRRKDAESCGYIPMAPLDDRTARLRSLRLLRAFATLRSFRMILASRTKMEPT